MSFTARKQPSYFGIAHTAVKWRSMIQFGSDSLSQDQGLSLGLRYCHMVKRK
jgi:hypothetical protein